VGVELRPVSRLIVAAIGKGNLKGLDGAVEATAAVKGPAQRKKLFLDGKRVGFLIFLAERVFRAHDPGANGVVLLHDIGIVAADLFAEMFKCHREGLLSGQFYTDSIAQEQEKCKKVVGTGNFLNETAEQGNCKGKSKFLIMEPSGT